MIISRTPLRISFVGGGSDLPAFYKKHTGAVVSSAINKFIYVNVNSKFDGGFRVGYSINEEVKSADEIKHELVRESVKMLNISGGVEITTIADVPSRGTGLGSSSSFTVGLLHCLSAYQGKYMSSEQLAEDSCKIEMDICSQPIGKQDQYAAAFGGFNFIEFENDGEVVVTPIICLKETLKKIEEELLVFFTGITRSASDILRKQQQDLSNDLKKLEAMKQMVRLAYDLRDELQKNNTDILGEILNENWLLKKSISNEISNDFIDDLYDKGMKAGASGGKILGAGAGGFLLFTAPKDRHESIKTALNNLRHIPVKLEKLGSRIIFFH
jgi:D-glycero-alpha-D-manno-heptose-7-phosphate kinase